MRLVIRKMRRQMCLSLSDLSTDYKFCFISNENEVEKCLTLVKDVDAHRYNV